MTTVKTKSVKRVAKTAKQNVKESNQNQPKKEVLEGLQTVEVDVKLIDIPEYQPRKFVDEKKLKELAENINQIGVIQAITLRETPNGRYELVCGSRRLKASILANKPTILSIIRVLTDDEAVEIALSENIQREDVNIIEEAESFKAHIDNKKETFSSLAVRLGKSEVYVRQRYKLNSLIDEFKQLLVDDVIVTQTALALCGFDAEKQKEIFEEHFSEDNLYHNNWRGYNSKKILPLLEKKYSAELEDVSFDITPCRTCEKNSEFLNMFPNESGLGRCLNRYCFIEKVKESYIANAYGMISTNPDYLIFTDTGYINQEVLQAIMEKGYTVLSSYDVECELCPELPEEPNPKDYTNNNGELQEEHYNDALRDYQEALAVYEDEQKDIQADIEKGEIKLCFILSANEIRYGYYEVASLEALEAEESQTDEDEEESSITAGEADKTPLAPSVNALVDTNSEENRIKVLKEKIKREGELVIEKSVGDIKQSVLTYTSSSDLYDTAEVENLEENIFYFYLFSGVGEHVCKKLSNKSYLTEAEKWELVQRMNEKDKLMLMRNFIIDKMKHYAFSPKYISTYLFLEFSKAHFPTETNAIISKYEETEKKRVSRMEAEIKELEYSIEAKNKAKQEIQAKQEPQEETSLQTDETAEAEESAPITQALRVINN